MKNNNFTKGFISNAVVKKVEVPYLNRFNNFLLGVNNLLEKIALEGIKTNGSDLRSVSVSVTADYRLYLINNEVYIRFNLPKTADFSMTRFDSGLMIKTDTFTKSGLVVIDFKNFVDMLDTLDFTFLIDKSNETLEKFYRGEVKNLTGSLIIAKDYPELVRKLYAPELEQRLALYKSFKKNF